jgi:hypothetical protein
MYSAEIVTESVQTLASNRIVQRKTGRIIVTARTDAKRGRPSIGRIAAVLITDRRRDAGTWIRRHARRAVTWSHLSQRSVSYWTVSRAGIGTAVDSRLDAQQAC